MPEVDTAPKPAGLAELPPLELLAELDDELVTLMERWHDARRTTERLSASCPGAADLQAVTRLGW